MFATEPRINRNSDVLRGTDGVAGQIINVSCILISDSQLLIINSYP
jgi:hypothetical protein